MGTELTFTFFSGLAALVMKTYHEKAQTRNQTLFILYKLSDLSENPGAAVRRSSRRKQQRSQSTVYSSSSAPSSRCSLHQPAGSRRSSTVLGTSRQGGEAPNIRSSLRDGPGAGPGVLVLNPGDGADPSLSASPAQLNLNCSSTTNRLEPPVLRQAASFMKAPGWVQEPSAESGIFLSENSRRSGRCPPEGRAESECCCSLVQPLAWLS